ncbi:MAG: hypothetical protein H0T89_10780 [Deltaproteobacteria bacterium]|nr:hypothetical protein [Deltaproteobacteria bacterium]
MAGPRELCGDLAVLVDELAARWLPPPAVGEYGLFARYFAQGERLFHLAIEVGIACEGVTVSEADLAPLVTAIGTDRLFADLCAGITGVFMHIGFEYGQYYGVQDWGELAICMSGLRFLRDLLHAHPEIPLDPAPLEQELVHWGHELYRPLDAPSRMPLRHWWWFAAAPPL